MEKDLQDGSKEKLCVGKRKANHSRKKQSILNIISGFGFQVLSIALNFITRTIFIHSLGSDYLGINGLFSNILSVLSLTDLGISSAMAYSLYKPLADNDTDKLAALTTYFRKVYRILAVLVLMLGIAVIPFLDCIVSLETDIPGLRMYYVMYLLDAFVSYLSVSRISILTVDQNDYVVRLFRSVMILFKTAFQIVVLVVFGSFFSYLLIQIGTSVFCNVALSRIAEKRYPFIVTKNELSNETKKNIWRNVKDMFSYKIGGVILNNTDLIIISLLVGIRLVYTLIIC